MKRAAVAFPFLVAACSGRSAVPDVPHDAYDESAAPALDASAADGGSDPCNDAGVPPSTLECAGLYADFARQTLAPNAMPYAPAAPLWSDGAEKERWIELPSGQKIDISNPNEWVFPVGTKVFTKQFTYMGRRVETRMFQKGRE